MKVRIMDPALVLLTVLSCLTTTEGGRALPIASETYAIELFQQLNPAIKWDYSNFLVDLSGIYSKCSQVGHKGKLKEQVDGMHPDTKQSIAGLTDYTRGELKHAKAVNGYLTGGDGFRTWIEESPYMEQIRHAEVFGCSVRPGCSGFVTYSCLFSPGYGSGPPTAIKDTTRRPDETLGRKERPEGPCKPSAVRDTTTVPTTTTTTTTTTRSPNSLLDPCKPSQRGTSVAAEQRTTPSQLQRQDVTCDVRNCLRCREPNKCFECIPGMVPDFAGVCIVPCDISNCRHCNEPYRCSICERGFEPTGDGRCETTCNLENCVRCDSPNRCAECVQGMEPTLHGKCALEGEQRSLAFTEEQYLDAEQITKNKWDRSHFLENLSGYDISCDMIGKEVWTFKYADAESASYGKTVKGIWGSSPNVGSTPNAMRKILQSWPQIPTHKVGCSVMPACRNTYNELYVIVACIYEI